MTKTALSDAADAPATTQAQASTPNAIAKKSKPKLGKKKKTMATAKPKMTLFGYWRSGCSWRVRLVLALKGFHLGKQVEYKPVHLVREGGEQKQEWYTAINPA